MFYTVRQPWKTMFQKERTGKGRKFKPRAKHPTKVHICGGISKRGANHNIVIFMDTMMAI